MWDDKDADSLRRMAGLATPMALRVAVSLGLPDLFLGQGATADQLAEELGLSPLALDLLLAHLVTLGIMERTPAGYRTTEYGANLCRDAGNGLANLLHVETAGGRAELALVELAHSIRTGQDAYSRRYGQDFWADLTEHPNLRDTFDRQMTARLHGQVPLIVAGVEWSRFATVVDVGGGAGTLLAAILSANPMVHGHLVDLAATAATARQTFSAEGLTDRVDVTGGSFFDPLPAGADAYVLVDILHDWDDEHAHQILARCVEAAGPAGRILVIEPVGGLRADTEMDLVMLALYAGRERRVEEFRTMAAEHGLTLDSVTTLTPHRALLEFHLDTE